jgi:hypothetical protein
MPGAGGRCGKRTGGNSGGRTATGLDRASIQAVRAGAQPGDPQPPLRRMPFIKGVSDDAEVIILGTGSRRCVAVSSPTRASLASGSVTGSHRPQMSTRRSGSWKRSRPGRCTG